MQLAFAGTPEIRASRDEVWRRILDPQFVGRSAPGVESVEVLAENRFRMTLGFGIVTALLLVGWILDRAELRWPALVVSVVW